MWSKAYKEAGAHFSEHPHVSITVRQRAREEETRFFLSPATVAAGMRVKKPGGITFIPQ